MFDKELSKLERRDWLRLIRTENVGPVTFYQLLKKFGSATNAIQKLPELTARATGKRALKLPAPGQVDAEMKLADHLGARFIAACEAAYPVALKAISDPPPILCVKGDISLFSKPAIGIVGARNASVIGRKLAATLARDLGAQGVITASGLARGIDGAAHEAALQTGTIAVVAGGIDVIYPPEHDDLTREIATRGVIMSELPLGYHPKARDFPRRNRLISGISLGVIVVEAALKSGTLITARFALEQDRDVFAVPGSPLDPRCQGTNGLIRDGARLIENAQDVMEAIQYATNRINEPHTGLFAPEFTSMETTLPQSTQPTAAEIDHARTIIEDLMGYTPVHRDLLIRESDLAPTIVADILLELVLSGRAIEQTGGLFSLDLTPVA